jgi:flagellar basal body rod protein FlgG
MAGGYYTALSGLRARQEALDRIASDIANSSTAGYKTERAGTMKAERPSFGAALQSAVDVIDGEAEVDLRPGPLAPTGRSLDLSIEGEGFFVVTTPAGDRYTRNGHLLQTVDGTLTTEEGDIVQGTNGPIKAGAGEVEVDPDGTVRSGGAIVGTLKVVRFGPGADLEREGASRFRTAAAPTTVEKPSVRAGALEQSNVSVVDRIAELTEVSRSFGTLMRAVTVLMNDIDKGAITELGRR